MKEWSNIFGITFTKNLTNNPQPGYTQMVYGNGLQLVGYSAQGVCWPHRPNLRVYGSRFVRHCISDSISLYVRMEEQGGRMKN